MVKFATSNIIREYYCCPCFESINFIEVWYSVAFNCTKVDYTTISNITATDHRQAN